MKGAKKGDSGMSFIVWVILALLFFAAMWYVYNNYFAGAKEGACSGISETFKAFIYDPLGIKGSAKTC